MSEHPLEIYADSYDRMARDKQGDGRVHCTSVATDIRQNMIPITAPLPAAPAPTELAELPPLPSHPEPHSHTWSELERKAIHDHARAAYAMGRASAVRDYVCLNDAALATRIR